MEGELKGVKMDKDGTQGQEKHHRAEQNSNKTSLSLVSAAAASSEREQQKTFADVRTSAARGPLRHPFSCCFDFSPEGARTEVHDV